MIKLNIEDFHH